MLTALNDIQNASVFGQKNLAMFNQNIYQIALNTSQDAFPLCTMR